MNADIQKKILLLAEQLAEDLGLAIWGIENHGATIRVILDTPAQNTDCADANASVREENGSGVTIDQCEVLSRRLGLALDVEDCMPGSWTLEVSSPGLDRRFFNLEQMRPYGGDIVEVKLENPLTGNDFSGRKVFRGKIMAVNDSGFELELCTIGGDGRIIPENLPSCHIPWEATRRVARVPVFEIPCKPGKNTGKKSKKN